MSKRISTLNAATMYRLRSGLPSRKNKTIAIIGFMKEWKKAENK
jgi:hypothetical protein